LPTGRIFTFTDNSTAPGEISQAHVVDIPTGGDPATTWYHPLAAANLFCAGHAFNREGRLMVVGGQLSSAYYEGISQAAFFDSLTGYTWSIPANSTMAEPRWYPSVITLANGDILAIGGTRYNEKDPNKIPEVWQTAGGWRRLTSASKAVPLYPWVFQAPNGKVYLAGNWQQTHYLDVNGNGRWQAGPARKYANRDYGSVVMYDTGKILALGGGSPATATAECIDLRAKTPTWQLTGSMRYARRYPNATVLPDGKVLVTGGSSGKNDASVAVLPAEMWDPATDTWTTMASMQVSRIYHSSAVLLPDGRVLSAGGGRPAAKHGVNNFNAEIYSPPYLFRGPRPVIAAGPSAIGYASTFTVGVDCARPIAMVNLIRLSSTTHCFNMGQRFVRLTFSAGSDGLTVTAPANGKIAPPGHYLLHAVDDDGVPSIGAIVQVG
jgi:hypothetical protein